MFEFTLDEMQKVQQESLTELIELAGDDTHLSKMLGISVMTVRGWTFRGRVSKKGALLIASHPVFGKRFKAEDIRPDINV